MSAMRVVVTAVVAFLAVTPRCSCSDRNAEVYYYAVVDGDGGFSVRPTEDGCRSVAKASYTSSINETG